MAAYNGQREHGPDRNFVSTFPRNNYGSTTEDTFMRRPFERDSPMHQRYSAAGSFPSRPQQSFSRGDEQTRGTSTSMNRPLNMADTGNPMANVAHSRGTFSRSEFGGQDFQRPEFSGQNFQRQSEFNGQNFQRQSEFSGQNFQRPSEFSGQNFQRPSEFSGQNFQRPSEFSGQNFQRPSEFSGQKFQRQSEFSGQKFQRQSEFSGQKFQRQSEFSGQNFQRSEFGDKSEFRGSDLNDRTAFPRTDLGNAESFSRSGFARNGMFSRAQVAGGNMQSVGPSRPMNSGNMFGRPQMPSSAAMFAKQAQFDCKPMSRSPMAAPRMQFPYGGGANQRAPPDQEWNVGPNWRNRSPNTPLATQKKPFAATQQNKPKFKPTKRKSKKRNRTPSKLKDDGKKLKPWMTDELYAEVKKKNEMYFKAKAADSTDLWQEFRLQRNKVSSLIKEAKVKAGFLVRKKKEDEDDGKEKPYSCDTCDRAFAEESKLEEHLREHKKCEIDGCQFEAHPKVVEVHRKLQHDTGYAAIISKLDNAAEIQKWRNARKSHFPTLENVKKRQAEQEERLARGEVLETKDFGSKNEDVKDSPRKMPQTQQGVGQPEVGGEDREEETEKVKEDSHMEN